MVFGPTDEDILDDVWDDPGIEKGTRDQDAFDFLAKRNQKKFSNLLDPEGAGIMAAEQTKKARKIHQQRSRRSRLLDEQFTAPLADDVDQWAKDPSRFDFPGVDTPRDRFD